MAYDKQGSDLPRQSPSNLSPILVGGSTHSPVLHVQDDGDWIDAFPTHGGRDEYLNELSRWILADGVRVIGLIGIGGVGKTTIAAELCALLKDKYELRFWKSLVDSPKLASVLAPTLKSVRGVGSMDLSEDPTRLIPQLLNLCTTKKCLLVLDNYDAVFDTQRVGSYRPGYDDYGLMIRILGSSNHRSCVIVTSRQTPPEMSDLEGIVPQVRSRRVMGLKIEVAKRILDAKGLEGSKEEFTQVINGYSGNPMALRLVAETIHRVYGGSLRHFLDDHGFVFGRFRDVLEQTLKRLTELEMVVLRWFAIERNACPINRVTKLLYPARPFSEVLSAVESLLDRALLDNQPGDSFAPQNILIEHITTTFADLVEIELENGTPHLLATHALMRASAKSFVREAQERLIIRPIIEQFYARHRTAAALKARLLALLSTAIPTQAEGYLAGNIMNIMCSAGISLDHIDFHGQTIREAYLSNAPMRNVSLNHAHVQDCSFAETFGGVLSLEISPDVKYVAGGCIDGNIYIWNIKDGILVDILAMHQDWVSVIRWSVDGRLLVSASYDTEIHIWNLEDLQDTSAQSGPARTRQPIKSLRGHKTWIRALDISHDTHTIYTGDESGIILLWDREGDKAPVVFERLSTAIRALRIVNDRGILVAGGADHIVRMWDLLSRTHLKKLCEHEGPITSLDVNEDKGLLASASHDRTAKLWRIDDGKCIATFCGHSNWVLAVAFGSDKTIMTAGVDQDVRVYSIEGAQLQKVLQGHTNWINTLKIAPGEAVLISGSADQTIRFWDTTSGECLRIIQGYDNGIKAVAFSSNSERLASGANDGVIRVWDVARADILQELRGHDKPIWSVSYNPNGRFLASAGEDHRIQIWDAVSGNHLKSLYGHSSWTYVAFSPCGTYLASSGSDDRTVIIWDCSTWKEINRIDTGARVWAVSFSPDESLLASANYDRRASIWDWRKSDKIRDLGPHDDQVWAVDFNSDGTLISTGSEDHCVRIWDAETGKLKQILREHRSWVLTTRFSPRGGLLASEGSDENAVRVWDLGNGTCIRRLSVPRPWSVAFSPNGALLAAGSYDGNIRLWKIDEDFSERILAAPGLYEKLDITECSGLSSMTRVILQKLGAFDRTEGKIP